MVVRVDTLASRLERDRASHRAARVERVISTLRERAERADARGRSIPGAQATIEELTDELVAIRRRLDALPRSS